MDSQGRTRGGGVQRRVSRMRIRGFDGRNGRDDAEKLDIVVHVEGSEGTVDGGEEEKGAAAAQHHLWAGRGRCDVPFIAASESQFQVTQVTLLFPWQRAAQHHLAGDVPFIRYLSLNFKSHKSRSSSHGRGQETSLHHRHWNGWLGQIDFRAQAEYPSARPGTAHSPLCPQPRPRGNEHLLRAQH